MSAAWRRSWRAARSRSNVSRRGPDTGGESPGSLQGSNSLHGSTAPRSASGIRTTRRSPP
jgi:hypothetical protein